MKKRGMIKLYKDCHQESLSYKLQELNVQNKRLNRHTSLFLLQPLLTYLWITNIKDELLSCLIILLQAILFGESIVGRIKSSQKLIIIKQGIIDHLKKYEPQVIETNEDVRELIKRI